MDQIATASGVTKVTVYQHFRSKEDLLVACLRWRLAWREAALDELAAARKTSESGLLAIIDWTARMAEASEFRGCAFVKATNETAERLPEVRQVAAEAKRMLRERLCREARAEGVASPKTVGCLCALLLEGAQVLSVIEQSAEPFRRVRRHAATLLADTKPTHA